MPAKDNTRWVGTGCMPGTADSFEASAGQRLDGRANEYGPDRIVDDVLNNKRRNRGHPECLAGLVQVHQYLAELRVETQAVVQLFGRRERLQTVAGTRGSADQGLQFSDDVDRRNDTIGCWVRAWL